MIRILVLLNLLSLQACGLTDYVHEVNDTGTTVSTECAALTESYQSNLKTIVESSCKSCHISGGTAASSFTFADDDAANAVTFANLLSGDGNAVFQKASGQVTHGGGAQVSSSDEGSFTSFFASVSSCS